MSDLVWIVDIVTSRHDVSSRHFGGIQEGHVLGDMWMAREWTDLERV